MRINYYIFSEYVTGPIALGDRTYGKWAKLQAFDTERNYQDKYSANMAQKSALILYNRAVLCDVLNPVKWEGPARRNCVGDIES